MGLFKGAKRPGKDVRCTGAHALARAHVIWTYACVVARLHARASERVSATCAGGGCAGRVEKISLKPVDSLFAPPSAATAGAAARTLRSASACRCSCTSCGLGYAAAASVASWRIPTANLSFNLPCRDRCRPEERRADRERERVRSWQIERGRQRQRGATGRGFEARVR